MLDCLKDGDVVKVSDAASRRNELLKQIDEAERKKDFELLLDLYMELQGLPSQK